MKTQAATPLKLWAKLRIQYGFADEKEVGVYQQEPEKAPNRNDTALWSCDYVCTSGCQGRCMNNCQYSCMSSEMY